MTWGHKFCFDQNQKVICPTCNLISKETDELTQATCRLVAFAGLAWYHTHWETKGRGNSIFVRRPEINLMLVSIFINNDLSRTKGFFVWFVFFSSSSSSSVCSSNFNYFVRNCSRVKTTWIYRQQQKHRKNRKFPPFVMHVQQLHVVCCWI